MVSHSFSETGNLLKRRGAIYEKALSEKCRSNVHLDDMDYQRFVNPCPLTEIIKLETYL